MKYQLVRATYADDGKFDGRIIKYSFIDEKEDHFLVYVEIADKFKIWKEEYGLNDDSMLKFVLLAIKPKLLEFEFYLKELTVQIFLTNWPYITFSYEDFDIEAFYLEIE